MLFHKTELRFRKWIDLENKKSKFIEATESEDFPERVFAYLSVALDSPVKRLDKKGWDYTVQSLLKAATQFSPNQDLPILKGDPKDSKKVDWEYDGRTWAYYSHLLGRAYGWTLEYIANLDVNEALAHVQEILTEEHLEHEFYYGLSELAYPYNKTTKTSHYKEMKKPYWMKASAKPIKKVKIKRSLLPVGAGVDLSGMPDEYGFKDIIANGQQ